VSANVRRRLGAWVGAAALLASAACATNPVTGRSQLSLVSEGQEIQLGRQSAADAERSLGLVDDQELQQYVQRVGAALAAQSERPGLPWTFRVVDDPTPNAFALPGGYIFLTRGMMDLMDSEAELAAVIGHEIGHVTARHSVTQISRAQLAQIGLLAGAVLFPTAAQQVGNLAQGGLQLLFLRYSRDAERQADELGFRYALSRSYDVREMDDVFASLARIGEKEQRSALPSWLSTHPAPQERIQAVAQRVAATQLPAQPVLNRPEYLRQIDGLVYGENPRNGYFRGGLFLHPDLRFQVRFPEGWRNQNLSQAVTALSPRQDAAIQLGFAGVQGAEGAAQRFFGQQGLQAARVTRESFSGLPAVVGYFQAQTQQGGVTGIAAFIEYNGNTYQLLTYAPGQSFGSYEQLFRQVVGSFAPLNDPSAINVKPNRLRIVRIDRPMTLAAFNRQYPSAIPLPELAILNGVEGEGTTLPAGTLVKRVVAE
jgi:predicted Zn-dependent protease